MHTQTPLNTNTGMREEFAEQADLRMKTETIAAGRRSDGTAADADADDAVPSFCSLSVM